MSRAVKSRALDGQQVSRKCPHPVPRKRGPGRPRLVSDDELISAGVAVADADGVDGLTMARVASELGVATMTLYNYVSSRDHLVRKIIEAVMSEPTIPRPPAESDRWRQVLTDSFVELHVVMRSHWRLLVDVGPRVISTKAMLRWLHGALGVLEGAGHTPERSADMCNELLGFVLGGTLLSTSYVDTTPMGMRPHLDSTDACLAQAAEILQLRGLSVDLRSGVHRILGGAEDSVSAGRLEPQVPESSNLRPLKLPTQHTEPRRPVDGSPAEGSPEWFRERAVSLVHEVVDLYQSQESAVHSVAAKLGLPHTVLRAWVQGARTLSPQDPGELKRLQRELAELQQANEILRRERFSSAIV